MKPKELLIKAQRLIGEDLALTEKAINAVRGEFRGPLDALGDHVLGIPGKRLRPTILLLSARLNGHSNGDAPRIAAIVELIHTATLIHDDSIDEAQIRRGRSTVHVMWDHHIATMLGDVLYSRAFEMLMEEHHDRIALLMARASHTMSRGELLEFLYRDRLISESTYFDLIWSKTAAFMGACCSAGAILGGMSDKEQEALGTFGEKLGMAFQVIDDILDYSSSTERLGKEVLADLREGKATLPLIVALRVAGRDGDFLKDHITSLRNGQEDGAAISSFVTEHGGLHYAQGMAEKLVDEAKASLNSLPNSIFKSSLQLVADYTVLRER